VNPNDRGTFKWRPFGWTFKKQEIRDLRDKLQHSKATLSLSLGIINSELSTFVCRSRYAGRTDLLGCYYSYAIESGNQELSKQIESGNKASINVADDSGNEPLRTALDAGSTEMACMSLSHGGSVQTRSRFIVDVARRERMGEKRLILRCFGCVADEGKEDELLDLLSNATHGAPSSLENAVMEILHDAESSFISETAGLAKSFSERKTKLPVESSEQGRDVKRESHPDCQLRRAKSRPCPLGI
jgi:hypothetical protein